MRGWGAKVVLAVMVLSLAVTGVGWNEPALASGPDLYPIPIPGLDVFAVMDLIDCFSPFGQPHMACFW
ncbi:hypothetical protein [Antarctobacter jejuensis]|uniref:hypothetical protein n=1 Tax=Antarctobacter jejuensis TaxID=1439938 RepID=UPI003FD686C3